MKKIFKNKQKKKKFKKKFKKQKKIEIDRKHYTTLLFEIVPHVDNKNNRSNKKFNISNFFSNNDTILKTRFQAIEKKIKIKKK